MTTSNVCQRTNQLMRLNMDAIYFFARGASPLIAPRNKGLAR